MSKSTPGFSLPRRPERALGHQLLEPLQTLDRVHVRVLNVAVAQAASRGRARGPLTTWRDILYFPEEMDFSMAELTTLEQHALLAALRLDPNGYGVTIRG